MTLLGYFTGYETAQIFLILGIGAILFAAVIAYGWRKQSIVDQKHKMETARFDEGAADARAKRDRAALELKEQIAQNEFNRRVQWKGIEGPTIEHKADAE